MQTWLAVLIVWLAFAALVIAFMRGRDTRHDARRDFTDSDEG